MISMERVNSVEGSNNRNESDGRRTSSLLSIAEHQELALEGMRDLNQRALETFARDAALERFRAYRLVISGVQRLAAEHHMDAKMPITATEN